MRRFLGTGVEGHHSSPGCQISYMDPTPGCQISYMDPTGCHHLIDVLTAK
jgi:hypothetical protein